jgi:hypothetical protein
MRDVPRTRRLLNTAAFFVALSAATLASVQQPKSSQSSGGRILLATVVDRTGRPQVDLEPDDFVVSEDGEEREILDVHIADYPVAVLIDDSADAATLQVIKSAVSRFIVRIGERPVAVGSLSNPTQMMASLEDERADVLSRLSTLTATESSIATALPAVANAAHLLGDTGSPFSAIVVVTAKSIDATQPVQGELLPSIADSGAVVHVVAGRPPAQDGVIAQEPPDLLHVLSDQTHGQYTAIFSTASYGIALDRLADRLSAEMMVEYLVPANTPAVDVRVGVRKPGARVLGLGVSK